MLAEKNTLDAAQSLAVRGRYQPALALLDTLDESSALYQDSTLLKGKILAQMGDYTEAIKAWENVISRWPNNRTAQKGIQKARRVQKSVHGLHRMRILFFGAMLILGFALLAISFELGRRINSRSYLVAQSSIQDSQADMLNAINTAVENALEKQQNESLLHQSEEIESLRALISAGRAAIEEVNDRLKSLQNAMATQRSLEELTEDHFDFKSDFNDRLTQQSQVLVNLSTLYKDLRTQQEHLVSGQIEQKQKIASFTQSLAELDNSLSTMKASLHYERLRADKNLSLFIETLRPPFMDSLASDIKMTEQNVEMLRKADKKLQNKNYVIDYFRHRSVKKELEEAEAYLTELKERWEMKVVPWMRAAETAPLAVQKLK